MPLSPANAKTSTVAPPSRRACATRRDDSSATGTLVAAPSARVIRGRPTFRKADESNRVSSLIRNMLVCPQLSGALLVCPQLSGALTLTRSSVRGTRRSVNKMSRKAKKLPSQYEKGVFHAVLFHAVLFHAVLCGRV